MKKINVLISTFFGNGYISKIPGTFTSLSTLIILYILFEVFQFKNLNYILILYSITFFYSFYAVMDSETEFENKDPRQIVIDEVLGQAMPIILIVYLSYKNLINIPVEIYYFLSFILFRFFDIVKPFPVSYFDKQHKNFFGIIMDDIMAGLYTMLIIYLISLKF
ncbi:phosphatidylglycerophosphatase A [Candidatus Pelagibacter sp.]|nr:phosphatidylglycerophosphatase A [Candidatus Pelagibacter sp.]